MYIYVRYSLYRVEKFYGTAQARKEEDIKGIAANPRKKKKKANALRF